MGSPLNRRQNQRRAITQTAAKTSAKSSELGDIIQVIRADELETLGIYTIEDALKTVGNIAISNAGGIKNMRLRGAANGNTKVLYNGIDLKDSIDIDNAPNYSFIPIENIERIEIMSGSSAVMYGSGSSAGVINITPKSSSTHSFFQSKLTAQQYHTTAKTGLTAGPATISILGSHNYDNRFSSKTQFTEKDARSNQTVSLELSSPLYKGQLNGAVTLIDVKEELDDADENFVDVDDPDRFNKTTQHLTQLTYTLPINPQIKSSIRIGHTQLKRVIKNQADSENLSTANAIYKGINNTIDAFTSIQLPHKRTIIIGSELTNETGSASGTWNGSDVTFPKQSQTSLALYSQYRHLNNWVSMQLGSRVQTYEKNGSQKTKSSYHISLFRQIPFIKATLTGTLKSGFKNPSIYQKHAPTHGRQNLNAEHSNTQELTLYKRIQHLHLSATLFNSKTSDKIAYIYEGTNWLEGWYENIKHASQQGHELTLSVKALDNLKFLTLTYTNINAKDDGTPSQKVPRRKATLSSGIQKDKWTLGTSVLIEDEKLDWSGTIPAYATLDLSIHYDYNHSRKLFTNITNVFDKTYETTASFTEPGRTIYVGLKQLF